MAQFQIALTTQPVGTMTANFAPALEPDDIEPLRGFVERSVSIPTIESLVAHNPTIYDPKIAYLMSLVAGWSYSDGQTLADKLKHEGFDNEVSVVSVVNPAMLIVASAFIVRSKCGRVCILSFRGTEPTNMMNWLTDADVTQRAVLYGSVHNGFYGNLEAIWRKIQEKLYEPLGIFSTASARRERSGEMERPVQALYITGHSLGAAMAVLAAARILVEGEGVANDRLRSVYTYGQPAVGDDVFARRAQSAFGDRLFRHVYRNDMIPHLPAWTNGEYVHFGEERVSTQVGEPWSTPKRLYARQSVWLTATAIGAAASFVLSRLALTKWIPIPYSMDDHSPTPYIEASRVGLARG